MRKTLRLDMIAALAFAGSLLHCKSTGSATKDDVSLTAVEAMSEAQFVAACQQRLNDPVEGPATAQLLQQYVQTTDCKAAYPLIQGLVAGSAASGH